MLFKNKKNGKTYRYLAVGTDCTNSRDGTMVVIYCPDDDDHSVYVREYGEFYEKFEELSGPTISKAKSPENKIHKIGK